jgi:hypothetical protein
MTWVICISIWSIMRIMCCHFSICCVSFPLSHTNLVQEAWRRALTVVVRKPRSGRRWARAGRRLRPSLAERVTASDLRRPPSDSCVWLRTAASRGQTRWIRSWSRDGEGAAEASIELERGASVELLHVVADSGGAAVLARGQARWIRRWSRDGESRPRSKAVRAAAGGGGECALPHGHGDPR